MSKHLVLDEVEARDGAIHYRLSQIDTPDAYNVRILRWAGIDPGPNAGNWGHVHGWIQDGKFIHEHDEQAPIGSTLPAIFGSLEDWPGLWAFYAGPDWP